MQLIDTDETAVSFMVNINSEIPYYPWYRYSNYILNFVASYHLMSFVFTALTGNQFPGPRTRKAAEEHTFGSGCQSTSTKKRTPTKRQWSSLFPKAQTVADTVAALRFPRLVPKRFMTFRKPKSNTQLSTDHRLPHQSALWATELPLSAEQKMKPLPSSPSRLREVAPLKAPSWNRSVVLSPASQPISVSWTLWCFQHLLQGQWGLLLSALHTWSHGKSSSLQQWPRSQRSNRFLPLKSMALRSLLGNLQMTASKKALQRPQQPSKTWRSWWL